MQILSLLQDYLIPFLIVLTILVFVHEMGHYLIARRCGVRIEAFSIGFGPELFGWTDRTGTRWKFSAIPLGGYVKMFGDADVTSRAMKEGDSHAENLDAGEHTGDWADGTARPLTEEEKAVSFHHKSLSQRSWIVAGGPLANFLLAIVILTGMFAIYGQPTTPPVVTGVLESSAAEAAGILPGDRIVEINGQKIERFEQIRRVVQLGLDAPLDIVMLRDGGRVEVMAQPELVTAEDNLGNKYETARLGIQAEGREYIRHGIVDSVWFAIEETASLTQATLQAVWQIVVGTRSADELGGPIRIAQLSGQVADISVVSVVLFTAILSVNLGLINLFPVPMLDGGHLLFYSIEALRGRPLGEKAQEYGFRIGLALVLSLFVFVTWNDLVRLRVIEYLVGLVT
ncbi:MAG: RIP metalloprotease RseP [Rhodovibrionaceae bacterium]